MITLEQVKENEEIKALIEASSNVLEAMNYTEHGVRHAGYVSWTCSMILLKLGYDEHIQELGKIAGYVHDIGNAVNRKDHGVTSACLVYGILKDMKMPFADIALICSAIGNHEEEIGWVVNAISAALVIADKSDAHRTRVKRLKNYNNDIHDAVNHSIQKNIVLVDGVKKIISVKFYMDDTSSVMDYLSIFLQRMIMSEKAAQFLGCTFKLYINDVVINTTKQMQDSVVDIIEDDEN
ncbi:MAG: HD domain-containing protein [Clostridia bacterium]